ncbi:MAG: cobalamin biosynthesis protein CbiD [Oscillospiraceae bacterium]|nr:cobalamin biosynthesis protein CbiD [Oscillospiraceae bacterium]
MDEIRFVNNKFMRCGYTTGSCAAAAAKAAARMLLTGQRVENVKLMTPKGIELDLEIEEIAMGPEEVSCAVRKDGGDDPDTTHGVLVHARVRRSPQGITIDGGVGVGRVTMPGLDQPVGNAAINHVPRQMITENVAGECAAAGYAGGMDVLIYVPQGEEVAKQTFNPHLGIVGGISILGTGGIVEPMSDKALKESVAVELNVLRKSGCENLLLTVGNYGDTFAGEVLRADLSKRVKCSNFIGDTLDQAIAVGFETLLLIGHIGKTVKLGAGIMDTHSHHADGRMDVLTTCALEAGADIPAMKAVMACATTDAALDVLEQAGILEPTMEELGRRIGKYLGRKLDGHIRWGCMVFTNNEKRSRVLCTCGEAQELLKIWSIKHDD